MEGRQTTPLTSHHLHSQPPTHPPLSPDLAEVDLTASGMMRSCRYFVCDHVFQSAASVPASPRLHLEHTRPGFLCMLRACGAWQARVALMDVLDQTMSVELRGDIFNRSNDERYADDLIANR